MSRTDVSIPPLVYCKRITKPGRVSFAGRIIRWLDRYAPDDF